MHMPDPPSFIRHNVRLADHTTIGLGGPARLFAPCESVEKIRAALAYADAAGLPVQVFAGGSNIIYADEGFDGLVLQVGLRGVATKEDPAGVDVVVSAGEPWDPLVSRAVRHGWGGIECLSGIPGSVGATPVQNVGAYGQEVHETVVSVRAIDRITLNETAFAAKECGFGYRQSRFKGGDLDRFIITEVRFRLRPNAAADIRYPELRNAIDQAGGSSLLQSGKDALTAVRSAVLSLRRKKSMVVDPEDSNSRSVGSFFTNPLVTEEQFRQIALRWQKAGDGSPVARFSTPGGVKVPAAWLVEKSGFTRGFRSGGAGISQNHSLALVNCGGTTRDIIILAGMIQQSVFETFGVRLEREPVVVPFRPSGEVPA